MPSRKSRTAQEKQAGAQGEHTLAVRELGAEVHLLEVVAGFVEDQCAAHADEAGECELVGDVPATPHFLLSHVTTTGQLSTIVQHILTQRDDADPQINIVA
ncbi:hypothetical protein NUW54_g9973 [Trametes sanguinea]|uniref:Uncharacterized protein n=1 Tax=Trametes sanguinea TaxID=158606 RepID=A0ACC1P5D5_9APHY|nr:hypothetical protein NUW54_g9973 [Trametes sanguinea]